MVSNNPLPFTAASTMSSQLLTTWSGYQRSIDEILALTCRSLSIFDADLALLKLDDPARHAHLQRLLVRRNEASRLTIVVQRAEFVHRHCPRLLRLLSLYAPALSIIEAPSSLAALQDSLLIADERHLLVRFDRQQPRARQLIDAADDCTPYVARFAEILAEGGQALSPTTLGL